MFIFEYLMNESGYFFQNEIVLTIIVSIFLIVLSFIILLSIIGFFRVWRKSVSDKQYKKMREINRNKKMLESCNNDYLKNPEDFE